MRDSTITALAVGGSEVAALVGLDPNRDAFAIYAEKLGLVEREPPTPRMRMGKKLEKIIAEVYEEETGQLVVWDDTTRRHPERPWQACTIDAFVYLRGSLTTLTNFDKPMGLLDAKNVSWDQSPLWGEAGTDQVPDRIGCPPIGHSDTTARYLRQRFPRNVQNIRQATPDEVMLLARYKQERAVYNEALARKTDVENEVKSAIADCDGIDDPVLGRVTYKYVKSQVGADWKAVAEAILADWSNGIFTEPPGLTEYAELHRKVLREGFRRMAVPKGWKTMGENDDA